MKPTAHSVSVTGSGETIITSSPIVFTISASAGNVASTVSTKRSTRSKRLLVALLLRVASEPGQVDEAERHLHPAELALAAELGLHVPDDVLLDVEA